MKTARLLIMVVFLVCNAMSPALAGSADEKAVVASARAWLSLIDAGHYAESWQQASAYFQGAISQEAWQASLTGVRKPLGRLLARTAAKTNETRQLPGAPDGAYLVMRFTTSFKNKRAAIETVTFMREKDGTWRAAGYFIR